MAAGRFNLHTSIDAAQPFSTTGPRVTALAFTADGGSLLAAAGASIRRYSCSSGVEEAEHRIPGASQNTTVGRLFVSGRRVHVLTLRDGFHELDLERGAFASPIVLEGMAGSAAVHPDGERVALGTIDGSITVVDRAGTRVMRWSAGGSPRDLAWSSDGERLYAAVGEGFHAYSAGELRWTHGREILEAWRIREVAGGAIVACATRHFGRGTMRILDAQGVEQREILSHETGVSHVAASADGSRVLTSSADNAVRVWDVAQWTEIATIAPRRQGNPFVVAIALSADGALAAQATEDGRITLLRADRVAEPILAGGVAGVRSLPVAVLAGPRVIAGHRGAVRVHDPSGERVDPVHVDLSGIASAGDVVVGASSAGPTGFGLLQPGAAMPWVRLAAHDTGGFGPVAVSDDGRIAACARGNSIRTWDLAARRVLAEFGSHPRTVRGWELDSDLHRRRTTFTVAIESLALSSDGRQALSIGRPDSLRHWETATGVELQAFPLDESGRHPRGAVFASRDRWALVTDLHEVAAWDLETRRRVWAHPAKGASMIAVREGLPFAVVVVGAAVELRLIATGERADVHPIENGDAPSAIGLSADGRWLAIGTQRDRVLLLEIARD